MDAPAVLVAAYPPGSGRVVRREAVRPVYAAVVAEIGEPTLYGGSAAGPSVRWHTGSHVVLLAGGPQCFYRGEVEPRLRPVREPVDLRRDREPVGVMVWNMPLSE